MLTINTHYINDVYILLKEIESSISVEKSLFIHDKRRKNFVCGLINNQARTIILEILENRIQNTMRQKLLKD